MESNEAMEEKRGKGREEGLSTVLKGREGKTTMNGREVRKGWKGKKRREREG